MIEICRQFALDIGRMIPRRTLQIHANSLQWLLCTINSVQYRTVLY